MGAKVSDDFSDEVTHVISFGGRTLKVGKLVHFMYFYGLYDPCRRTEEVKLACG